MTYQIADGTTKVVIPGDVVNVVPGFLPDDIGPFTFLLVTDTSRPDLISCNMHWSQGESQAINLDPKLINTIWRKQ